MAIAEKNGDHKWWKKIVRIVTLNPYEMTLFNKESSTEALLLSYCWFWTEQGVTKMHGRDNTRDCYQGSDSTDMGNISRWHSLPQACCIANQKLMLAWQALRCCHHHSGSFSTNFTDKVNQQITCWACCCGQLIMTWTYILWWCSYLYMT